MTAGRRTTLTGARDGDGAMVEPYPREDSMITSRTTWWVPVGPALMLVGYLAPGEWAGFFGLLSTPFLLVTVTVAAAAGRAFAPRAAVVALAGLVANIVGLAALHGIELAGAGDVSDDLTAQPAGILLAILFFGGNLVGSVALVWAQLRTRTLPRWVPMLNIAAVVGDFAIPDGASPVVKSAGIALFVVWSVALAVALHGTSARVLMREEMAR
jgi:hypothetical protein